MFENMFECLIAIAAGLFLLNKGADWFVDSCNRLALRFRISPFVIGFFGVAFATSLPEIVSTWYASFKSFSGIAVGNIVGSNIANIGLIFGLALVVSRDGIKLYKREVSGELEMLLITLISAVFLLSGRMLSRAEGAVLLSLFVLYLWMWYRREKNNKGNKKMATGANGSLFRILMVLFGGIVSVFVGAYLVVNSAKAIAEMMNVADTFIGVTLVAVGTSLPELFTTIATLRKNYTEMLFGDLIGSNIVNLLVALGGAAVIRSIPLDFCGMISAINMVIMTVVFTIMSMHRKYSRYEGVILLLLYTLFMYVAYVTG